jgi:hypothetical protein
MLAGALAGCVSTAQPTPQAAAISAPDAPSDYRAQIVAYAKATLKDPFSIRSAEISQPRFGFVGALYGGQKTYICARFNGKNSYGAYVGIVPTTYIFDGGKLIAGVENGFPCISVRDYQPFPELEQIS